LRDHLGFYKRLRGADWPIIDYYLDKRKRGGKESEVTLHGMLIPRKKVRKEILRNRQKSKRPFTGWFLEIGL